MKHYFSESKLPEKDKTRLHKQMGFIFQVASNISGISNCGRLIRFLASL